MWTLGYNEGEEGWVGESAQPSAGRGGESMESQKKNGRILLCLVRLAWQMVSPEIAQTKRSQRKTTTESKRSIFVRGEDNGPPLWTSTDRCKNTRFVKKGNEESKNSGRACADSPTPARQGTYQRPSVS